MYLACTRPASYCRAADVYLVGAETSSVQELSPLWFGDGSAGPVVEQTNESDMHLERKMTAC